MLCPTRLQPEAIGMCEDDSMRTPAQSNADQDRSGNHPDTSSGPRTAGLLSTPAATDPGGKVLALPAGVIAAARLKARLTAVWREIGEAGDPLADPEAVHRLRVATRRSLAALTAFAPLLPTGKRQRFGQRLRQIRKAAGEARDLDVLIDRLRQQWPDTTAISPASTSTEKLIELLTEHQIGSRGPIRDCQAELVAWGWPARQEQLLKAIATTGRPRYGRFARKRLQLVGRKFFTTAGPFRKASQLHQFRILGKRLRYSLDLFTDALSPQPRDRCLKRLKQMQEALGDFTDHAAAADRFTRLTREPLDAATLELVDSLRREEHQLARLARRRFDIWWTNGRRKTLKRLFRRAVKS
jgi:CHAD domain-containing protein